jgi:hypothetical protein
MILYGGDEGNRTPDTAVMSRLLYQLSYIAPRPAGGTDRPPAHASGREEYGTGSPVSRLASQKLYGPASHVVRCLGSNART